MKTKRFIPLSYDLMFKKVFGDSEKIERLELLLSIYFNIPIELLRGNVVIINNEQNVKKENDKRKSVDILLKVELVTGKERINIEVNRSRLREIVAERNILYASNIFSRGLKKGDSYDLIEPVIQINFDVIDISTNNKIIDKYYFQNDKKQILTKKLQIHHVNIERCKKIWYDEDVRKYTEEEQQIIKLGSLLGANTMEEFNLFLEEMDMEKEIKEDIRNSVEEYNSDSELWIPFDKETDEELIRNTEISVAKREGIKQEKMEIAKKMLEEGFDINSISKITNLSIDEIHKL